MSGAATGGLLAIRAGPKVAGKNALAGGVILAMIEGLNVAIQVKKRLPKLFISPCTNTPAILYSESSFQ